MANEFPLTLAQLRLRVLRTLEDVDWLDPLSADIAATPTSGTVSATVNDPANWTDQSRWEIDLETFLVTSGGSNPVTLQRALEGTSAAAHTSGTYARRNPRHLTPTINEAINVVVHNWCSFWFSRLVWDPVGSGTGTGSTFSPTRLVVTAPADAFGVEDVQMQYPAGYTALERVSHGELQTYPTDICSTGLGFRLQDMDWVPGFTIRVLYSKRWPYLSVDSDEVPADFPDEASDLITLGAALYIAGYRQIPKGRPEDISFSRESGTESQVNFSAQVLSLKAQEWLRRAEQVASARPRKAGNPKVFMGFE